MIVHHILLPFNKSHFRKFHPIQKQEKTLKTFRYLVKTTLVVYLTFHKLIFLRNLIVFLEPTIKLISGMFDL